MATLANPRFIVLFCEAFAVNVSPVSELFFLIVNVALCTVGIIVVFGSAPTSAAVYVGFVGCLAQFGTVGSDSV